MLEIFQLAAVGVRQTGKAPECHPQRQIRSLDMRGGNVAGIGSAIFDAWDGSGYPACGTVPFRASDVMTGKQFDEHDVISASSEVFLNCRNVPAKPVSRKLKTSVNSFAEIAHESIGTHSFTLPDMKTENHFRDAIECDPHVLISPFRRRVHRQSALMAAYKAPNFIRLYKLRANAANLRIPELAAVRASSFKNAEDRGFVQSCGYWANSGRSCFLVVRERKQIFKPSGTLIDATTFTITGTRF
jgi:hypothetical protein